MREFARGWPSLAREIAGEGRRVDEPGVDEPGVGKPGVGKPGVGKPGVGKPGVDERGVDKGGVDKGGGDGQGGDAAERAQVAVRETSGGDLTGSSRALSLTEGSGLLAGYALARERLARGELGPAAFRELCAFELRWRVKHGAATPRPGPALRLWRRRGPTPGIHWVVALKTPWGAERWWSR